MILFFVINLSVAYIKQYETVESCCLIHIYLVDPASSHTLVLKIKPCMSKCFDCLTLDCRRLIITVIVLLRLPYRWIPVEILELIHVANNMSFRYIELLFYSNQSVSTLWMIHNNAWRSLYT